MPVKLLLKTSIKWSISTHFYVRIDWVVRFSSDVTAASASSGDIHISYSSELSWGKWVVSDVFWTRSTWSYVAKFQQDLLKTKQAAPARSLHRWLTSSSRQIPANVDNQWTKSNVTIIFLWNLPTCYVIMSNSKARKQKNLSRNKDEDIIFLWSAKELDIFERENLIFTTLPGESPETNRFVIFVLS